MFFNQKVCPNCEFVGTPVSKKNGSFLIEIVLWCCLFVPGIFYTMRRWSTKVRVCPHCGNPNMIAKNSPKGYEIINKGNNKIN